MSPPTSLLDRIQKLKFLDSGTQMSTRTLCVMLQCEGERAICCACLLNCQLKPAGGNNHLLVPSTAARLRLRKS